MSECIRIHLYHLERLMARGQARHAPRVRIRYKSKEERDEVLANANWQALQHGMFLHYFLVSLRFAGLLTGVSLLCSGMYDLYQYVF